MRRLIPIASLLIAFSTAVAQEDSPPLLADLAKLNLHVVKAEMVEELRTVDMGGETVIAPTGDNVLVVVTLEGLVEQPWRLTLATDSFTAIYEFLDLPDDDMLSVGLRRSSGITGWKDRWLLKPDQGNIQSTAFLRDPGPITIKAAFIIPDDVDTFSVRVPTVAEGEAEVIGG